MRRCWISPLACLALLFVIGAGEPPALKNGDQVVLIGDDLIERDQKAGYLETLLTLMNPGKELTFRNLGWSGDTVFGDARAGFGGRADGFRQLKEHVSALRPSVIVVGYGMSESFDDGAGLSSFEAGYQALLDVLSSTKAQIVLVGPIGHEDLGRPLPDPAAHNQQLSLYRAAIARIAAARGLFYVDPSAWNATRGAAAKVTDDGIHPTEAGYWLIGSRVAVELAGHRRPNWQVRVAADGKSVATGTRLSGVQATPRGVRFEAVDDTLPLPPAPTAQLDDLWPSAPRRILEVTGLEPGRYTLKIDGTPVMTAAAGDWLERVLGNGPEFDQVERLRRTINAKNRLYFYRWRPQNETYLFGFRKHEQGNNAREIPLFDPLVAAKEKEIARLRVPVRHIYELVQESGAGR